MYNDLSLLKHCKRCHASCCKTGELIGSPILTADEVKKMPPKDRAQIKEITSPVGEKYWIIAEEGTSRCHFLNENEECKLQNDKPLDCLCYPLKAIWKGDEMIYILDVNCPAAEHLSTDFYEEALKIAKKSIMRFKRGTYNHWLENYVGWVKTTAKEVEK